jgi:hypothetical protein
VGGFQWKPPFAFPEPLSRHSDIWHPVISFQMKKATALVVLPAGGGLIYFECSELGGVAIWHKSSYELRNASILSRMGNSANSFHRRRAALRGDFCYQVPGGRSLWF